jgi:hypothetical protein
MDTQFLLILSACTLNDEQEEEKINLIIMGCEQGKLSKQN